MLNAGQKYCRMIPLKHSAILLTFIKIFVLSIFEWLLKTGFTVSTKIPLASSFIIVLFRVLRRVDLAY